MFANESSSDRMSAEPLSSAHLTLRHMLSSSDTSRVPRKHVHLITEEVWRIWDWTQSYLCVCPRCEFGTSADHAVFACLPVCVWACAHHVLGRQHTHRNRYKHRHTPIWSLIRRADCPDFTLSTEHEQLSINNKNTRRNVFNAWHFGREKKNTHTHRQGKNK